MTSFSPDIGDTGDTGVDSGTGPADLDTSDGPGDASAPLDDLVTAVRRYRDAESAMRARSRDSMKLGRTDMTALRLMLHADRAGNPLNAAALSRDLQISTAATTVLIDRLERSGHAERRRNPKDARSVEVHATAASHDEVRSTMGDLHERMMEIAARLLPQEAVVVRRFLEDLGAAVDDLDLPCVLPSDASHPRGRGRPSA